MCSPIYGQVPEFYGEGDDWNVYYERLEQFFAVNDVPANKQSAFLISVIGSYTYKTLRDLCHPALPKDKTFIELCQLLQRQFSPQVSIFRERSKFYNAVQEPYESISQWYIKVKKLSVDCRFGATLETVLLDKFVTGLRPGAILDRLCEENETTTLKEALDIAVNKESALALELPPQDPICYECCVPPPPGCEEETVQDEAELEENVEEEPMNDMAPLPEPMMCKRIIVDKAQKSCPEPPVQVMDCEPPVMGCPPPMMMASAPMPTLEAFSAPRPVMRKAMVQRNIVENVQEEPILYDDYVEQQADDEEKKKKARRGCRGGRKNKKSGEN